MKFWLTLIVEICLCLPVVSQQLITEIPVKTKNTDIEQNTEALVCYDEHQESYTFFFINKNTVTSVRFDKYNNEIAHIIWKREKDFIITARKVHDSGIDFIGLNNNREILSVLSFDFENQTSSLTNTSIRLIDEYFVSCINAGNHTYLLTVEKDASIINLYNITDVNDVWMKTFDFQDKVFNHEIFSHTVYHVLHSQYADAWDVLIQQINADYPLSPGIYACLNKIYLTGNKIYLTFDEETNFTYLIIIDLDNYKADYKKIPKADVIEKPGKYASSNSYILGDYFFQILFSNFTMSLSIKELASFSLYKEYHSHRLEKPAGCNTPVYLIERDKENTNPEITAVENTKRAYRMLSKGTGISAMQSSDTLIVETGACLSGSISLERHKSRSKTRTYLFGDENSHTQLFLPYNPFQQEYNPGNYCFGEYFQEETIYFKSLFSADDGTHLNGTPEISIYEKIEKYITSSDCPEMRAPVFFKQNNHYVFGFFDTEEAVYKLVTF